MIGKPNCCSSSKMLHWFQVHFRHLCHVGRSWNWENRGRVDPHQIGPPPEVDRTKPPHRPKRQLSHHWMGPCQLHVSHEVWRHEISENANHLSNPYWSEWYYYFSVIHTRSCCQSPDTQTKMKSPCRPTTWMAAQWGTQLKTWSPAPHTPSRLSQQVIQARRSATPMRSLSAPPTESHRPQLEFKLTQAKGKSWNLKLLLLNCQTFLKSGN